MLVTFSDDADIDSWAAVLTRFSRDREERAGEVGGFTFRYVLTDGSTAEGELVSVKRAGVTVHERDGAERVIPLDELTEVVYL